MGFMILGMTTMFFDFYTAPLITLGLPLLGWLICDNYSAHPAPVKKQALWSLKALAVWFGSYVSMWLTKLVLTEVFTGSKRVLHRLAGDPGTARYYQGYYRALPLRQGGSHPFAV